MTFTTRGEAGQQLAVQLQEYAGIDTVVAGMGDGGLTVAAEIANALRLPLDVLVVPRTVEPGPLYTHLGVVAERGHGAVNADEPQALALTPAWLEGAIARGDTEVCGHGTLYHGGHERREIAGQRVIVVTDAMGAGLTLGATVAALRAMGAREIIVALPVAPASVVDAVRPLVERVVCLATPAALFWNDIHYPPADKIGDAMCRLLELGVAAVAAPAGQAV